MLKKNEVMGPERPEAPGKAHVLHLAGQSLTPSILYGPTSTSRSDSWLQSQKEVLRIAEGGQEKKRKIQMIIEQIM